MERFAFATGIVASGAVLAAYAPASLGSAPASVTSLGLGGSGRLALSGLLVGFGTARGNGCTSGHGIFGNARGSLRSMAATVTFMAAGAAAATAAKTLAWRNALAPAAASASALMTWPPAPSTSVAAAGMLAMAFGAAVALTVTLLPSTYRNLHHQPKKVDAKAEEPPHASPATAAKHEQGKAAAVSAKRAVVTGCSGLGFGLALGLAGMVDPVSKHLRFFLLRLFSLSPSQPFVALPTSPNLCTCNISTLRIY